VTRDPNETDMTAGSPPKVPSAPAQARPEQPAEETSSGPSQPSSPLISRKTSTVLLGIIATLMVGYTLRVLGGLVVPLLVAFFLSFLLWPLVETLRRRRVPGPAAVVVALLLVLTVMGLFGLILHRSIRGFRQDAPRYEARLRTWAKQASEQMGPFSRELKRRETLEKLGSATINTLYGAVGTLVTTASKLGLILIYLLFILSGRLTSTDRIGRAFAPDRAAKVRRALQNVDRQVLRYLGMKSLINLATGLLFGLSCWALGVDAPALWGFLGFLISYVPTIGSIISPVPPTLLALLQFPDEPWRALVVLLVLGTIVALMFNLVEPKVLGSTLGLSPLVVMFALLFFGWMWGVWGMILSVPLAAIVKILLENFESTRPLAVFME